MNWQFCPDILFEVARHFELDEKSRATKQAFAFFAVICADCNVAMQINPIKKCGILGSMLQNIETSLLDNGGVLGVAGVPLSWSYNFSKRATP